MSDLTQLWHKHHHLNVERVRLLESIAKAALRNRLERQWRIEGEQAAHQLAASFGTFGFAEASTAAFEIEAMLRSGMLDFRQFAEALLTIREVVDCELTPEPASAELASTEPDGTELSDAELEDMVIEPDLVLTENPDVSGETKPETPPVTARIVLCATDQELIDRLRAVAVPLGSSVEVVSDVSAAIAAITSTPAAALVLDLPSGDLDDLIVGHDSGTGVTAESAVAMAADKAAVFVLADTDDPRHRMAAVRAGAIGFLCRQCPAQEVAAFISAVAAPPIKVALRVLVVDDDPGVLRHIVQELPEPSCHVTTLGDPMDCWPVLADRTLDVALIDLDMPGVGGLDLCHMLRSDPRWRRLPVIMMVDHLDIATAESAFAAGADDLIAKPVIGSVLRARIAAQAERCR